MVQASAWWFRHLNCFLGTSFGRYFQHVLPGGVPGAWEHLNVPTDELEEVAGVREVWASLINSGYAEENVPCT